MTTLPASVATNISQIVRGNVNIVTTANTNNNTTTVLPIAKVLPQQQNVSNDPPPIVSVGSGQSVYIHSLPPSAPVNSSNINITNSQGNSIISAPTSCTYYMPVTTSTSTVGTSSGAITVSTAVLQSITTNTPSITTNVSSSTSIQSYAPQAGSFAVVPSSNRNIVTTSTENTLPYSLASGENIAYSTKSLPTLVSSTVVQQSSGTQQIPVRFNPQLIVDGSHHITVASIGGSGANVKSGTVTVAASAAAPSDIILPYATKSTAIVSTAATRKRDIHPEPFSNTSISIPIKSAVKNLNPTLMSLGAEVAQQLQQSSQRVSSPISRPGSSDGSTTVSATSSPGIDQQEQEELNAMSAYHRNNRNIADGATFKTAGSMYTSSSTSKLNAGQISQQNSSSTYGSQPSHIISYQSHPISGQPQSHFQVNRLFLTILLQFSENIYF